MPWLVLSQNLKLWHFNHVLKTVVKSFSSTLVLSSLTRRYVKYCCQFSVSWQWTSSNGEVLKWCFFNRSPFSLGLWPWQCKIYGESPLSISDTTWNYGTFFPIVLKGGKSQLLQSYCWGLAIVGALVVAVGTSESTRWEIFIAFSVDFFKTDGESNQIALQKWMLKPFTYSNSRWLGTTCLLLWRISPPALHEPITVQCSVEVNLSFWLKLKFRCSFQIPLYFWTLSIRTLSLSSCSNDNMCPKSKYICDLFIFLCF